MRRTQSIKLWGQRDATWRGQWGRRLALLNNRKQKARVSKLSFEGQGISGLQTSEGAIISGKGTHQVGTATSVRSDSVKSKRW